MNFEPVDRHPFLPYFGVWPATWQRWQKEGLGENRHWTEPFDFDVIAEHAAQFAFVPVEKFVYPFYAEKILKDDGVQQLVCDRFGVTKLVNLDGSGMTNYAGHPVTDRASWETFKERLNPHTSGRLSSDWERLVSEYNNRDYVLGIGGKPLGLFSVIREFMGAEPAFMAVALEPDWVREMAEFFTDFWLALYEKVLARVRPDFLFIWELVCNYQGPMISPRMFDDLFMPSYRKLIGEMKAMGVRNVWLDCQGNCWDMLALLVKAGATGTLPLEVRGGMDIWKVRKRYPRLQMIGGIERMALVRGIHAIDRELARVAPMVPQGGYLPTIDHSFSADISWDNFKHFIEGLKRITSAR